MLQTQAAKSGARPWHSFAVEAETETGVVLVVPASYLAEAGLGCPMSATGVRALDLRPGPYIVWSPQMPDRCVARFTVGANGTVLVGCPARLTASIGVEAYNRWMIDTDFLRRGDGSDYLVIEIPGNGRSARFGVCFVHDPA